MSRGGGPTIPIFPGCPGLNLDSPTSWGTPHSPANWETWSPWQGVSWEGDPRGLK